MRQGLALNIVKSAAVLAAIVAAALSGGQSFNIDADWAGLPPELGGGVPDPIFGAAAEQPGVWNSWDASGDPPTRLTGLDGSLTDVVFTGPRGGSANGFNNPENTGPYAALLNDGRSLSEDTWTFTGLASGIYRLITYAASPSNNVTNTLVTVLGAEVESYVVTGPMPGNAFEISKTHSIHQKFVTTGELSVTITEGRDPAYLNGFQLVQVVPEPATSIILFAGGIAVLRRRIKP
ncbi:MAG: PEP-CTERM sorting domain-containing protein [Fimbriimonadaceae bacterium]